MSVRFRVEPLYEEHFHGVMHIRNMAIACLEYGMKPLCGLGVCYKNDHRRHFYLEVEINEQTLLELNLPNINVLQPGFVIQNNKHKFTVVDDTLNLMKNTAHSMFETYYDASSDTNIFRYSPFYGKQEKQDISEYKYGYDTPRDEYSSSVSYNDLASIPRLAY